LLAINLDEAAALTGITAQEPAVSVVDAAIEALQPINSSMQISITAGSQGSWTWNGEKLIHAPIHEVEVVSTAGAGDAFFAGLLVALAAGLSLFEAQQLGTLVAALSVTSPHTINKDINRTSLKMLADRLMLAPPVNLHNLLEQ
jgi:sugar/nucleoside kinase (ribokinase family)